MFLKARPTMPVLLQAQKKLPYNAMGIPTVPSPPGQGEMMETTEKHVEGSKVDQ